MEPSLREDKETDGDHTRSESADEQSRTSGSMHEELMPFPLRETARESDHAPDPEKDAPARRTPSQVGGLSSLRRIVSQSSTVDPGPAPDGGIHAWLQVLAAHLVIFNAWGYIQSFGVFQTYYTTILDQPPSKISWIGSLQLSLLFLIGTVSGRATDAGLFRPTVLLGSALIVLALVATSFSTEYWQLLLAQGLCQGLGVGLCFCPFISLLSAYFSKRRVLAMSLAASGTSSGGLVYPALIRALLPRIGFPWIVRVVALVALVLQIAGVILARPRLVPRRTASAPLLELPAFREPPYALFAVGIFLIMWGCFFAFYYVGAFAAARLGLDPQRDAVNLLLVMNGTGIPGRLIPAYCADRFVGPLNMLVACTLGTAAAVYGWAGVRDVEGLYAFAAVYGFASAGVLGLLPGTLSSLTEDLRKMGVRMGMVFSIVSVACATGPPIAGALIQSHGGDYLSAQMFAGSAVALGAGTLWAARVAKAGWRLRVRA